jgi:hypothetical protein
MLARDVSLGKPADKNNPLLDTALQCLERGWSVIPVHRKVAATKWRPCQDHRPDDGQVREWFGKPQRRIDGLAVVHGPASGGLAVRDFDIADSFIGWADSYPELANALPSTRTGRGFHVFFRAEGERYDELPDGELRADHGHYTVLPPSRHPSGGHYRWHIPPGNGPLPFIDPVEAGFLSPASVRPVELATQRVGIPDPLISCVLCVASSTVPQVGLDGMENVLVRTLPAREGERHRRLFDLARELKAFPHLADADGLELEQVVRHWHARATSVIRTKVWEGNC